MPRKKITALWLEKLKNTETGRVEYSDTEQPGLWLRVGKQTKTWVCRYRVEGDRKLRRFTIGKYPAISLKFARQKAAKILSQAAEGKDPGLNKQIKRQERIKAPTFEYLAETYLKRHALKQKAPRSVAEDQRIIQKDLLPLWANIKAKDIKRRDVIQLLDSIVDRSAPIQANRTLALVRKIYNFGISRDLVENNPCYQVKAPGKEKQRDRVLSGDEIKALWDAFNEQRLYTRNIFKLRLLTAQRGGEVISMRWQDIDFKTGWWTIPAEKAKNNLTHRVPLSPIATDLLNEVKEKTGDGDYVFPARRGKYPHFQNIQKAAERIRARSKVSDFVSHDLRRTAASHMTGMGIPRLVVSKILNHVEQGVTRVYDRHSYDKEKRQALDRWAKRLEQILTGEKGMERATNVKSGGTGQVIRLRKRA